VKSIIIETHGKELNEYVLKEMEGLNFTRYNSPSENDVSIFTNHFFIRNH